MQFGSNLPFLYYGDIGRNAWGWRGYATDGFIPKRGFQDVKRVLSNPVSGRPALVLTANIVAQDPVLSSGEVATEPAISMPVACPKVAAGTLLNLDGVTVTIRICMPTGAAGHLFQFSFASQSGSLHSDSLTIDSSWEGKFTDLSYRVRSTSAFDATRVSQVGFVIAANPASVGARIQGDVLVESLVLEAAPAITYDFSESLLEKHFRATSRLATPLTSAAPLVRVFTLVDGRTGILWNTNGSPEGLDNRAFTDYDTLLDSAERAEVQLIPVLLDFHWADRAKNAGGVQLGGRSNVIRDPVLRQKLLNNVLDPILKRYGNRSAIRAWEIMNEPEWVLSGIEGRTANSQKYDPIHIDDMREFFRQCAQSIRRLTRHDATVGSARRSWVSLWKSIGLTLYCWHYYDSDPSDGFPWRGVLDLGLDGPVYVTEVPTAGTKQRASDYWKAARQGGYQGLCLWSCRAQDEFSDMPAATTDLNSRIPQISALVNGASYQPTSSIAPDSWLVVFGSQLAPTQAPAPAGTLPSNLNGVTVSIVDSNGRAFPLNLMFVSVGQINCLVPPNVPLGSATLTVNRIDGGFATTDVQVNSVVPGLFTANANGEGAAAAQFARVMNGRVIRTDPAYRCDANGKNCQPAPFRFGPANEDAVFVLFATGIRHHAEAVAVLIGDQRLDATYAGSQNQFQGLDQVNVLLPRDVAGSGELAVSLSVDGLISNTATILIE